ncbi:GTPase-activating protein and VPS9 domain-containing protein 1-like [Elysia marginata]|uniref:GTPase-activating protein and VPS9 domain-containing protein 1-like n=1 Tax=Elysia marginata TaxID=1093978 RepID=A0AAV4G1M9_9GAST|nr:GTPase-activating protein and VPS9 domain-containing protein 1-like [Elysia marginata]
MSLTSDILELSQQLQQEHLFVTMERESLQRLYHNVTVMSEQLFHTTWVASQQKLNLHKFMSQGINASTTSEVYSDNNQLEATNFVDSYKVFSYHDSKYGELMRFLYEHPTLLAMLIIEGEERQAASGEGNVAHIIGLTVTSVYGSCLFHEDEQAVLRLLKTLLDRQVANSDNPRRLVRRQSTAFSRVYKHLCESLFSARLFLTAALYDPIMRLLMEDEWFFDIDPDKAFVRFAPAEKLRRFGEPGTEEHKQKQAQYRAFIVDKLVFLAMRFINSIKANIQCFPATLGWLVSQVYRVLTERGQVSMQEVRASCADLVFALFICPAICDPEPHGITSDVPISHIARHNLMQMAQIIQVLAMSQWEEIDPKVRDIYGKFEKGCMSSVLDLFLEGPWDDITEHHAATKTSQAAGTSRSAVLLTAEDVKDLISFIRTSSGGVEEKTKRQLDQLLAVLPSDLPSSTDGELLSLSSSGVYSPVSPETPGTPTSERKIFKTKGARKKRSTTMGSTVSDLQISDGGEGGGDSKAAKPVSDVLVLTMYPPGDCPGMLPEKKVLSSVPQSQIDKPPATNAHGGHSVTIATPHVTPNPEIQEKRTRFSLSHDQESIGNASDYQEVISEAASSHSVEDDEVDDPELETEDNFSDMMSANVSGRGSPSISGRDTPLSQAGSVEENHPPAAQLPVPVPETVRKQNRVDVTERFGKFEIKAELALERDECKSTVSDTWSTDVLASDSEPPELNQVDRLEEVAEEMGRPGLLLGSEPLSEISETASDAWSTDVLASDTDEKHSELLKDLDLEQDLLGGGLDREYADNSLATDEGEDSHIDMENMGAHGGGSSSQADGTDSFSDVFSEDGDKSGGAMGGGAAGSAGVTPKKTSGIVHHFQSGPSLQLPTAVHRQSQKSDGGSAWTTGASPFQAGAHPPHSSSTPFGGARSKVRDKRNRRGSSGGGGAGGDDGGMINEFDPLSSHGSGRRSSRDKILSRRVNNIQNTQNWVDHPGKLDSARSTSSDGSQGVASSPLTLISSSEGTRPGSDLPVVPPSSGRSGRTGSRDSGIDIWVSTNGQMSGNSPTGRASLDSSNVGSSPRLLSQQGAGGRASLDSNLQRLQRNMSSHGAVMASPDSGLHLGSSLDRTSGPCEIVSPLFSQTNSSDNKEAKSGDGGTATDDLLGLSVPSLAQSAGANPEGSRGKSPLMLLDSHFDGQPAGAEPALRGSRGMDKQQDKTMPPQIQVTNIFKTITCISIEEEGSALRTDKGKGTNSGSERESLEGDIARPFEQQALNLNERRLSSALTSGDSFTLGTDTDLGDLSSNPGEIPAGTFKDLSISFNDSVSIIEEEPQGPRDSASAGSDSEPFFSIKSDSGPVPALNLDGKDDTTAAAAAAQGLSASGKSVLNIKSHHRQDSSGSNQSGSSLKFAGEVQDRTKEQAADNISIVSDEKEFNNEGERVKKGHSGGGSGFLRTMKDRLHKGIKKKTSKMDKDSEISDSPSVSPKLPRAPLANAETTDEILAKYRTPKKSASAKSSNSPATTNSSNNNNNTSAPNNNTSTNTGTPPKSSSTSESGGAGASSNASSRSGRKGSVGDAEEAFFDPANLESCRAFLDAKRKLRLALSLGDVNFGLSQVHSSSPREGGASPRENPLINLLNTQLAEAINLQNKSQVAQLYEVIRCIKMFDSDGCKRLLRSMREDYRNRSAYISYLVRCRQGLLATKSQLQRLINRITRDKEICSKHLTNMCARNFLEKREKRMWRFMAEFQKLTMADEKIDLLEQFLQHLYQEMGVDPLWKAATECQIEDGQQAIERFLMSRIYTQAMFPNGDGDIMRDQLLQEHLRKLSKVISPTHKDLCIPHMYHLECPWPAAQKEIYMINAYRTPKDKIQCVLRCSQTIMNLLSMASDRSVPAADDFMPVLIFVLIKANPFGLLSTVQYVNSFYGNRLQGEEQYWWLQLTSAIEFIKNM